MNVYWWNKVQNFGDTLSHTLLNSLGIEHTRTEPEDADLVMTGSILEHLPSGWTGTILGAGLLREKSDVTVELRRAKGAAVRGPMSAAQLPFSDPVLGDPGLLAPYVLPIRSAAIRTGVLPHWSDPFLVQRYAYGHPISPFNGAKFVLSEIAHCRVLVTSSLHGAIVADAYGIPRMAFPYDSEFKWYDYAASLGTHPHFGELYSPPRSVVERLQKDLHETVLAVLAP